MRKYRNQLLIGILITLSIYIAYLFFADNQLSGQASLTDTLTEFQWGMVPLLLATQAFMILFRFITWQYYLGVIGARSRIKVFDSFVLFVSGFVLVVSPGKVAEVLKSVLLKAKTDVPFARSVPIVFAERIIDGLAVIILMSLALFLAGDHLNLGKYNGVDYNQLSRVITFSSLALIGGGLLVVQIKPLAYAILALIARLPLISRLQPALLTFYESSREIFSLRHVIPMTGIGVGVYFASALCFILVLLGFGMELTWTLCLQAMFIVGVTSAIGALSFVPNGAGITEISTVGMLLAIVTPDNPLMTPVVAAAAALIQGFFHKWLRVFVGLTVAIVFRERLFAGNVAATLEEFESEQTTHPMVQGTVAS